MLKKLFEKIDDLVCFGLPKPLTPKQLKAQQRAISRKVVKQVAREELKRKISHLPGYSTYVEPRVGKEEE
jgi:hypothetical protein